MTEITFDERRHYMPARFEQMLTAYLIGTDQIVGVVLEVAAVREPEKYRDAVDLVKIGRLFPRIEAQPGALRIALIDAQTGESIGDIFQYSAPALEARGAAN